VAAFDSFFAAPFAQGMPSMVSLGLDGRALNVTKHRWAPFEVGRISDDLDSLPRGVSRAESYIRMPVGQPAVLLNVSFYGTGVHNVNLTLTPRIRSYSCIDGWGCTGNPAWCGAGIDKVEQVKCTRAEQFNYSVSQNALHAVDTRSEAATTMSIGTSRGQVATPTLTTRGGEVNLQLTLPGWLTVAVTVAEALASVATEPTTPFAEQWTAAEQDWENQWRQAFSSSDGPVGQLPILETSDLKLSRVYYTSALTLLQLSREGGGVIGGQTWDTAHAAATTGECGGPNQYFWDTSFHAVATSLLQPQAMRTALLATLEANFFDDDWICLQTGCGTSASSQYSKQCFNMIGKYAFNVAALFTSLNEYLRTTGDISFLQLSVAGRTVDDWMERLAFDWKHHLSPQASLLTDYGMTCLCCCDFSRLNVHCTGLLIGCNVCFCGWDILAQEKTPGNFWSAYRRMSGRFRPSRRTLLACCASSPPSGSSNATRPLRLRSVSSQMQSPLRLSKGCTIVEKATGAASTPMARCSQSHILWTSAKSEGICLLPWILKPKRR
jgi:hypothetical protein